MLIEGENEIGEVTIAKIHFSSKIRDSKIVTRTHSSEVRSNHSIDPWVRDKYVSGKAAGREYALVCMC